MCITSMSEQCIPILDGVFGISGCIGNVDELECIWIWIRWTDRIFVDINSMYIIEIRNSTYKNKQ